MCVLIKQIKTQYKTCSALLILSRRWLHDTLDSFIESSLLLKIQSQLNLNIILTPKSTTATTNPTWVSHIKLPKINPRSPLSHPKTTSNPGVQQNPSPPRPNFAPKTTNSRNQNLYKRERMQLKAGQRGIPQRLLLSFPLMK